MKNPDKSTAGFTPAMTRYAFGISNQIPDTTGVTKKTRYHMDECRRSFLRSVLEQNPQEAYALPDFYFLMSAEIKRYCKSDLQKALFADWDRLIHDTPRFFQLFNKISAQLYREYQDAIQLGKPCIKHRYISITAKRRAFTKAIENPEILGELELACWGKLRYGY